MKLSVLGAGLAISAMAVSCGGSYKAASTSTASSIPTAPAGSAITTPAPNLTAQLLSLSDLPAGWSVDKTPDTSSSSPKCFSTAKGHLKAVKKAEANYQNGSNGLPALEEDLDYLPGQGQQAMVLLTQELNGCSQISFSGGGHTFSGTIGQMSFPSEGDQSNAWQINLTTKVSGLTVTAGVDVIAIRKSDTVCLLLYFDLGTPDISVVQQLAQAAASKLT